MGSPGRRAAQRRSTRTGQIFSPTVVDRSETYAYLSAAGEQSLSHFDVAGHPDLRVTLQRFVE